MAPLQAQRAVPSGIWRSVHRKIKRKHIALALGLVSLVSVVLIVLSDPAAAQSCDPTNTSSCTADKEPYEDMLANIYDIARTTLKYAGFITVFVGAVMWFSARRSSDRAQTGVWLLVGGLAMIIFYFGFSAFIGLLKWVAEG